jgi:hypothetical protein
MMFDAGNGTYSGYERKSVFERAPVEMSFLGRVFHVDDIEELKSVNGWIAGIIKSLHSRHIPNTGNIS